MYSASAAEIYSATSSLVLLFLFFTTLPLLL
jgi:hypothetical protein